MKIKGKKGSGISRRSRANTVPAGQKEGAPFRVQRILVPIDFSSGSAKALRYAAPFARQFGARLVLMYAVEPVATPDFAYHPLMLEMEKVVAGAVERLQRLCEQEGVEPTFVEQTLVRNGVAHREITETAKNIGADIIVIATHGNTGLKHVFLGSTAERVVRHAHCPVLVVRAL